MKSIVRKRKKSWFLTTNIPCCIAETLTKLQKSLRDSMTSSCTWRPSCRTWSADTGQAQTAQYTGGPDLPLNSSCRHRGAPPLVQLGKQPTFPPFPTSHPKHRFTWEAEISSCKLELTAFTKRYHFNYSEDIRNKFDFDTKIESKS